MEGAFGGRTRGGPGTAFIVLLFFYFIMGLMFSTLIWLNKDVFLTGTLFLTWVMFMIGALVLIEFHSVILSPDDYLILGHMPISSRTYFFATLTNLLFYIAVITTALGLAPIGAYFFTRGFNPLLGAAAVLATYLSSISVALAMILLYAGILRFVHPRKLRRALSYLQLVMSFLIYGGYTFLPSLASGKGFGSRTLQKTPWWFFHPATWFASYLDLAAGRHSLAEIFPALLSIVAIAVLIYWADSKLSLDYSERLAALGSLSEGGRKPATGSLGRSLLFKHREARAVALLIWSQFRFDQKFRLGVLGILPLTIFYLIMGLREGPLPDPFLDPRFNFARGGLLYLAVLLFPVTLKTALASSDSYQASWIFYATPADKERLVLATKNFLLAYFVFPYLALIAAVFAYFFRNPAHVLLHLCMLALLAHMVLQISVLFSPELPFSQPVRKGERSSRIMLVMMVGPVFVMMLLFFLMRRVYPRTDLFVATLAGLAVLTWLLEKAIVARVGRITRNLQFQG
jgi:hypothetical protein